MWRREMTMPPRDMVYYQTDITWHDNATALSSHLAPKRHGLHNRPVCLIQLCF